MNNQRPGSLSNEQLMVDAMKNALREYLRQPFVAAPGKPPPPQVAGVLMAELYFTFCAETQVPRAFALDMMFEGLMRAAARQQQQAENKPLIHHS